MITLECSHCENNASECSENKIGGREGEDILLAYY